MENPRLPKLDLRLPRIELPGLKLPELRVTDPSIAEHFARVWKLVHASWPFPR